MTHFPGDVSVVIVAHNALEHLPLTLASLRRAGCPQRQITVVDVASRDDSAHWLQQHWPEVHLLRLEVNNGPNPARNLGITTARTPYVLLMDADVLVEPETVLRLHAALQHDASVAIASPVVVYAKQPEIIQYAGTGTHFICEAVNLWQGKTVAERGISPQYIGAASGCALLLACAAARQVGLFDERYFLGKDDGEFTHRINLAGYNIVEIPQAKVLHHCRARGIHLFYYQIRNRWHYILKNYQLRTLIWLTPILLLHELLQFVLLTWQGHGITYLRAVYGLFRLLPHLPADRAKVARFRVRQDYEVFKSGPLVVRESFLDKATLRACKGLYDKALHAYWCMLRHTVLR
jgi:GT2 family glycosyltransferase